MEGQIEQILADGEDRVWPTGTTRDADLAWLPRKVDAVVGMRRVGKTWFLQQLMGQRVASGADPASVVYVNLEDERLWQLEAGQLGLFVDVFYRRHPHLRDQLSVFVFDEVQAVPGWERFVRRLVDTENVHVCVSGSSSKMLSREISTSLRGRSLATELFPFSFREFLRHRQSEPEPDRVPGKKQRSLIEHHFGEYLHAGGFPEVQGLEEALHRRVLQDYLDVVLLRDIVERHGIGNVAALRRLMRWLLSAPARLFSVNKLHADFRSQGIPVGKDSLHEFVDHFHDAYLFFPVTIHTSSERVRQSNPRKVYPVDTGLVTAAAPIGGWGTGQLLETLVYLELRRQGHPIHYYRHEDGTEVDFVVETPGGTELVQVSADISAGETRARELRALAPAMAEFGLKRATLVTQSANEEVTLDTGRVRIVPYWMWALGLG